VSGWLGLDDSDEAVERACAQISGTLRHYHVTTEALKAAGASDEVVELYLRLCEEAGPVCRRLLERESASGASGAAPRYLSPEAYALRLAQMDEQLAASEERLRQLERQYASLETQLHEVRASLLPLIRALGALRAVRDWLRSLGRGRAS